MTNEELKNKKQQILSEANIAKDRLYEISEKLRKHGYIRKANSCMNLVYAIEMWQNRG